MPDPAAMPPGPPTDWAAIATGGAALGGVLTAIAGLAKASREVRALARKVLGIDDVARDVRALTLRLDAQDRALMELAHADPRPQAERVARELRELRRAVHALARDPDATDPDADGAR